MGNDLSNQTAAQQAAFQASSLLLEGRPSTVTEYVADLRAVSGNDIRNVFRSYIRSIQYAYVGSEMAAPREEMLKW